MRNYLILILLILSLTACHKTESPGGTPEPTDTVVKKYLVKEYIENPDEPEKIIEWVEGFDRINRIVIKPGNPSFEVAYDFEYYANDSMRVLISFPDQSSLWYITYSNYMCHFCDGRIYDIDYYLYDTYQYTEEYNYDEKNRLISVINNGEQPHGICYVWDDDNVIEIRDAISDTITQEYHDFCAHIDPEFTMPYVLFGGPYYRDGYLTKPLWKNWRKWDMDMVTCQHEYDGDGYVTLTYLVNEGDTIHFMHYEYSK